MFDKGLAGLDFINELGVEVKAKGTVSELFADDDVVVTEKKKGKKSGTKDERRLQEEKVNESAAK